MKILQKKIIASSPYLNFAETEYSDKNGKPSVWYSAERVGNRKAVIIVPMLGDKLVVTKEYRVPIGGFEWSFPAGLIDDGESIETAARRELKEETGLDILEIEKVSPFVYNSAGLTNESIAFVFVKASGEISYSGLEESENIEVFLMDKSEIKRLLNTPSIMISAKSWLIFERFSENVE
jgi:ADP-ribose pyrophosphatase